MMHEEEVHTPVHTHGRLYIYRFTFKLSVIAVLASGRDMHHQQVAHVRCLLIAALTIIGCTGCF